MAYFGSPPTGHIDSYARGAILQLQRQVRELQKQVAELQARNKQIEAKLASTSEALDTVAGAA